MTDIKKTKPQDLSFVFVHEGEGQDQLDQQEIPTELRSGDIYPVCQIGYLDYNGVLNLECTH